MRISIAEACRRLILDEVVAVPTETVYGLAAPLGSAKAIAKVFALKRRPSNNPLIIHLADPAHLAIYAEELPKGVEALTRCFWPGPLTLVLPANSARVFSEVRAGLPTAAFRVPKHPATMAIIRQVGPLVAPSANLSGRPSATCPEHVEEDFGDSVPVVDGGPCAAGLESTILVFSSGRWQIGRLGALSADMLGEVLGYCPEEVATIPSEQPFCPGRLHRHYAPQARLRLGEDGYAGQAPVVVGYGDRHYAGADIVLSLGLSTDPQQVMQNLYETLRQLDRLEVKEAWVDMRVPREGLWLTVRERLSRAADH